MSSKITEVKFWSTVAKGKGPVARGSFTVADAFFIQFCIWETSDGGLQVTLPRTKNSKFDSSQDISNTNKPYFEEVGCLSKEVREDMTKVIVEAYMKEAGGSSTEQFVPSAGSDNIPF